MLRTPISSTPSCVWTHEGRRVGAEHREYRSAALIAALEAIEKIRGSLAIGGPLAPLRRRKGRPAGGPQLTKSGGPELRKSGGIQPRKLGGPQTEEMLQAGLGGAGVSTGRQVLSRARADGR
jgi:hypothetical protein